MPERWTGNEFVSTARTSSYHRAWMMTHQSFPQMPGRRICTLDFAPFGAGDRRPGRIPVMGSMVWRAGVKGGARIG